MSRKTSKKQGKPTPKLTRKAKASPEITDETAGVAEMAEVTTEATHTKTTEQATERTTEKKASTESTNTASTARTGTASTTGTANTASKTDERLSTLSINTIRTLAIDAVQAANSGHPGAPLGAAPMGYVLWQHFLRHNPQNPQWFGRDRFVLSAGHASTLLYSLLHLTGYDLSLDEIKNFRQWDSKTPGHPEFGHTAGVEATTGPLGQGAAMTVGMAMAETHLAARYNRPKFDIFDNYTYAILGDGDLQEGINHEAASLAGHLKLHKLIWLHDDNQIQLDTPTDQADSEDTKARFESYGWRVIQVAQGHDPQAIIEAITQAQKSSQPTLIQLRTVIGFASPRAGTSKAHGEPLGTEGVAATKKALNWEHPPFTVPEEVRVHMNACQKGAELEAAWDKLFEDYRRAYPELAREVESLLSRDLPAALSDALPSYDVGQAPIATRSASGEAINAIANVFPALMGGSADLSGSTKTTIKKTETMQASSNSHPTDQPHLIDQRAGRNVLFGVREFGMAAAANGLALYGGLRPLVGTFMVFADYLKPALRLSALQKQPVTYIFTHDSIGLGEDGPTHQPIEQLAMLRSTPNVQVFRPADANETVTAWHMTLEHKTGPSALVLSRQNLPILPNNHQGVRRGAYVLRDAEHHRVILIASGSEVHLALESAEALAAQGIAARVVSMPCMEVFRQQDVEYRESVLTPFVSRVALEAGSKMPWYEWIGSGSAVIGMEGFGASAPAGTLFEKFGFTVEHVVQTVKDVLGHH